MMLACPVWFAPSYRRRNLRITSRRVAFHADFATRIQNPHARIGPGLGVVNPADPHAEQGGLDRVPDDLKECVS
jgi:hypothetical protein